jgi:ferrochelatase
MSIDSRIGLLLVNLGSPEAPTPEALRPYLKEFLMDPDVIDIPRLLRWGLVNLLIVPRRAPASAELYQKIWTGEGSPLLVHSRAFADALVHELETEDDLRIALGMRYGKPGIGDAIDQLPLEDLDRLIVFPLYPQYAQSSTLTVQKKVEAELKSRGLASPVPEWIQPFYGDPRYIQAVADVSSASLTEFGPDFSLFSFHGLPERHLKRLHSTCLAASDCCDRITEANRNCYRAQSIATARSVAGALGIPREKYAVSFQSRLGRTPWIRPFTDHVVEELPSKGVRRLAVFCPSFVADCLETLDEIENRERDRFLKAGGEELRLIPSLNASEAWVKAAANIVRDAIGV